MMPSHSYNHYSSTNIPHNLLIILMLLSFLDNLELLTI